MCNSLIARTFIDYKGRRIHLCQNDANALLRIAFKEKAEVLSEVYRSMDAMVYGNEDSSIDMLTAQPPSVIAVNEILQSIPNSGPI